METNRTNRRRSWTRIRTTTNPTCEETGQTSFCYCCYTGCKACPWAYAWPSRYFCKARKTSPTKSRLGFIPRSRPCPQVQIRFTYLSFQHYNTVKLWFFFLSRFVFQALLSLTSWPFSAKILWAPFVDAFYFQKIGRRKSWLISVQLLMGTDFPRHTCYYFFFHLVDSYRRYGRIHLIIDG